MQAEIIRENEIYRPSISLNESEKYQSSVLHFVNEHPHLMIIDSSPAPMNEKGVWLGILLFTQPKEALVNASVDTTN